MSQNKAEKAVWYVYIVKCSDGTYYTGSTNDLGARIAAHNGEVKKAGGRTAAGGAKYTRGRRPVRLVYSEELASKSAAMRREWEVKQLTRGEKERLVQKG